MVNYFLDYKWRDTNDTQKQTESFRTYETKSTFIHFRSSSNMTLQLFSAMNQYQTFSYQKYGTDYDNISLFTKEVEDLILPNTTYTKHFANTSPYIFIRILNTDTVDRTGTFTLLVSNTSDKEFITASVRDSNLKLNQLVSLTRPTTDIKLDILDGNITGFSNVVIKAKGTLTNTEALLMNSDTIQGYFDSTRLVDTIYLQSDSSNDTQLTGIGARIVQVSGLDINKKLAQFTEPLEGTNQTYITNSLIFINSIETTAVGSLGFNSGHIRAYISDTATLTPDKLITSIELGEGQSFNPQYEVPSGYTLYITSMSIFGNCVDEGYIKIVKYTYSNSLLSDMLYKVLDKFNVSPQMNYNRKVNFTIQDGERVSIYRKSLATPQGTNDITIQLYGTLKLTNLDVQSTI